jgi:molybdopterin converting factor small subunit
MNIKFLGWISSLAGTREMNIALKEPVKLKEILPFSLEGRNVIIIINNRPGSDETMVKKGDKVALFPVISGG